MIRLRCSCGKGLRVRDQAAGRRIKCPGCGSILTVPRPEPPPDEGGPRLVEEDSARPERDLGPVPADVKPCPRCGVELPAYAVFCHTCGYKFGTSAASGGSKALVEKVPRRTVVKAVLGVAGLAVLLAGAYLAYNQIKENQEKARKTAGSSAGPSAPAGKPLPLIIVRTGFTYAQPRLRKEFEFHYDDGVYSPARARLTLREKIAGEALGRLPGAGLQGGVYTRNGEPPDHSLTLRIPVSFGWAYGRVGGAVHPKQPCVASCSAYLYLRKDIVLWRSAKGYAASPAGEEPAPAELAAVVALTSAKASVNFQEHAQTAAATIAETILEGLPSARELGKLLTRAERAERTAQSVLEGLDPNAVSPKARRLAEQGNQFVIAALADSLDAIHDRAVLKAIAHRATDPAIARRAKAALQAVTKSLGIKLVLIRPGQFQMGSAKGGSHVQPVRTVTITKGFYLGATEVTQAQWEAIMGSNPSRFKGPHLPVEQVSWDDCQEFCRRLTEHERDAGELPEGVAYRLPTEAEWEYACRAGSTATYCFGDAEAKLGDYAWYLDNSGKRTHPVGQKRANAWGLHDMHGNVCEWCSDRWHGGKFRVLRSSSWHSSASRCCAAFRTNYAAEARLYDLGVRVARPLP